MKHDNKKIYTFSTFINHYRESNAFTALSQKYANDPKSLTPQELLLYAASADDHRFDFDALLASVTLTAADASSVANLKQETLLLNLPVEIFGLILSFLTVKDSIRVAQTCKQLRNKTTEIRHSNLSEVTLYPFDQAWQTIKDFRRTTHYHALEKMFHTNLAKMSANDFTNLILATDNLTKFIPHIRLLDQAIQHHIHMRDSLKDNTTTAAHASNYNILDSKINSLYKTMFAMMLSRIKNEKDAIESSIKMIDEPAKTLARQTAFEKLEKGFLAEYNSILAANYIHIAHISVESIEAGAIEGFSSGPVASPSDDKGFINLSGLSINLRYLNCNYKTFNMENSIIDSDQFNINAYTLWNPYGFSTETKYEYCLNKSIFSALIANTMFIYINHYSAIVSTDVTERDLNALHSLCLQWDQNNQNGEFKLKLGTIIVNNYKQKVDATINDRNFSKDAKQCLMLYLKQVINIMLKHVLFNKRQNKLSFHIHNTSNKFRFHKVKDNYAEMIAANKQILKECEKALKTELEKCKKSENAQDRYGNVFTYSGL